MEPNIPPHQSEPSGSDLSNQVKTEANTEQPHLHAVPRQPANAMGITYIAEDFDAADDEIIRLMMGDANS